MEEIRKVTHEEMLEIIETRKPEGLFYEELSEGGFVACDNRTGDAWTEEFDTFQGCKAYLEDDESQKCWDCSQIIESYIYSRTIKLKNGEDIVISDLISEDALKDVEDEAKEEHGDNFEAIYFGEYCPHCLACM